MLRRLLLPFLLAASTALAQYNESAGHNAPAPATVRVEQKQADGRVTYIEKKVEPAKDSHGNAQGHQYDLAVDGAFAGQTVLILDQVGNTLVNTVAALKEKGFNTVVFHEFRGPAEKLQDALSKSCQVWIISDGQKELDDASVEAIAKFYEAGHGVYIWGDNDPYYFDANRVAGSLVQGLGMKGDLPGNKVVGLSEGHKGPGLRKNHLITTGLEHLYEGVTIATIFEVPGLTPLVYGSAGNLVTAAYEKNGKRLIIDGGFTRLAVSWDDAGTARYVKNAAAWLVNAERFKETVAVKR